MRLGADSNERLGVDTYELPREDGTSGQVLATTGSHVLYWSSEGAVGTPAGWQFNHAANSGHALMATFD